MRSVAGCVPQAGAGRADAYYRTPGRVSCCARELEWSHCDISGLWLVTIRSGSDRRRRSTAAEWQLGWEESLVSNSWRGSPLFYRGRTWGWCYNYRAVSSESIRIKKTLWTWMVILTGRWWDMAFWSLISSLVKVLYQGLSKGLCWHTWYDTWLYLWFCSNSGQHCVSVWQDMVNIIVL